MFYLLASADSSRLREFVMKATRLTASSFRLCGLVFCGSVLSACSQESEVSISSVSEDVSAVVSAAVPEISIMGGELNASGNQYEVPGTLPNGDEIEIDMVQANGDWTIIEIQRDVEWSAVPQLVRSTVAGVPDSFEPVRVIESTQAADGSGVYEMFRAVGSGASYRGPDIEVRWFEGSAEILP